MTRAQIEDFLYDEAALLDEWRLREWLALLTEDATYEVPATDVPDGDPKDTLFLVADNADRIRMRVDQLLGKSAWAENPPSRTRRLINNVRIREVDGDHHTRHGQFCRLSYALRTRRYLRRTL